MVASRDTFRENSSQSILCHPKKLGVSVLLICRMIRRDFSLHPCIVQLIQELKASQHKQRHLAAGWT